MSENELTVEQVQERKLILKGDDIQDGIDFSHFNFLIHIHHDELCTVLEDEEKSAFDALKLLWTKFYPYLEAEIEDKNALYKKYQEMNKDSDATVQIGMEFKFKLDHAEEVIRQSGKMLWRAYQTRLERASKQLDERVKQVVAEEKAKKDDVEV